MGQIVADFITTGVLNGALIKAKSIEAESLNVSLKEKIESSLGNEEVTSIVESVIKQSKDEIELSISNTYETKSNVETKISNSATSTLMSAKGYTDTAIKLSKESIELGVSETYATKTQLSSTNSDVTNLTNRVSSAESKLTKDSLTTTIGNHYTTSNVVDGIVTSKGYQTASQVQQTVDALEIKFSQSGGYNLLYNGSFNNGTSYWSRNSTFTDGKDVWTPYGTNNSWVLWSDTEWAGYYQIFPTVQWQTYSWSANVYVEKGTAAIGVENRSQSYLDKTDGWVKVYGTFQATSNSHSFCIYSRGGGTTIHINGCTVCEGQIPQSFTPHPSEVYDGITTIDKDGITVSQSNINTKTTMNASGFYINKNGQGDIFKVDTNGLAITGKITSNEVIMANGGIYTGQSVRGTNPDGFTLVGSNGSVALRADNGSVYLQPSGDEAKVTAPADPNTFKNLRANNLIANSKVYASGVALTSSIEKKKNIEAYEESALQQILQTKIYRYHLLDDLDEEMKRIGIILQEAPVDAIDIEGVGVDLYQMVTMTWKAIQELKQDITKYEVLEKRIEILDKEIKELKTTL